MEKEPRNALSNTLPLPSPLEDLSLVILFPRFLRLSVAVYQE